MIAMSDDETKKVIAKNLVRLRNGLSYSELGRRCGTNASAISKIEKAEHMPGAGLLTRIAESLGVPVEELLKTGKKLSRSA